MKKDTTYGSSLLWSNQRYAKEESDEMKKDTTYGSSLLWSNQRYAKEE